MFQTKNGHLESIYVVIAVAYLIFNLIINSECNFVEVSKLNRVRASSDRGRECMISVSQSKFFNLGDV